MSQPRTDDPPPRRGRPRDASVDARLLKVARAVYAERGWAGFNFDVVATQAKVSKDAIYRRYASKLELLLATLGDAIEGQAVPPDDGTPLRPFLLTMARGYFERSRSDHGVVALRIFVESMRNPELLEAYHREHGDGALRARTVVRRAMDEGRLPLIESPTALLDAILGGVIMHILATPPDLRDRMAAGSEAYLAELVDLALRGGGYVPDGGG